MASAIIETSAWAEENETKWNKMKQNEIKWSEIGCVENTIKMWNAIRAEVKLDEDTNFKTIQTWS